MFALPTSGLNDHVGSPSTGEFNKEVTNYGVGGGAQLLTLAILINF
jgi:hypothetical protein